MIEPARDRLMTGPEVAEIFRVNPRTILRWASQGLLETVRPNPQGLRRYRESQVRELLNSKNN